MRLLKIFAVFLAAFFYTGPGGNAFATGDVQRESAPGPRIEGGNDFTSRPYYEVLVRELTEKNPEYYNFGFLRTRYSMIDTYDPIGDAARNAILKQAYIVETSPDNASVEKALREYDRLMKEHMGNIGIVIQAIALAKQDRRFGDPQFYERVRNGLFEDVRNSGDGKTFTGAYDILILAEETMLLATLDVEVLHTSSRESGGAFYNMHSVVDRKTGRPFTIFTDITKPMEFLEKQRIKDQTASPVSRE